MFKFLDGLMFLIFIIMMSSSAFEEWIPKTEVTFLTYGYFLFRIVTFLYQKKRVEVGLSINLVLFTVVISCMWSFDIIESFKQAIFLVIQTLIIIFIAKVKDLKFVLDCFFIAGLIIAISSFITVQLNPLIATHQDGGIYHGLWEGVFVHKNNLANTMSFYILLNIFYLTSIESNFKKAMILVTILAQVYLIFMSGSTTGLILVMLIFLFYIVAYINKQFKLTYLKACIVMFLFAGVFLLGIFLLKNLDNVFAFFGKDTSLTGRDQIWLFSLEMIKERLIFGYGYRSTFIVGSDFYNNFIANFNVNSLHNGYLEYLSYFGILGVVIIVPFIYKYIKNAFNLIMERNLINYLPLAFFAYLAVINISESAFIGSGNPILWIYLVYLFKYLQINNVKNLA